MRRESGGGLPALLTHVMRHHRLAGRDAKDVRRRHRVRAGVGGARAPSGGGPADAHADPLRRKAAAGEEQARGCQASGGRRAKAALARDRLDGPVPHVGFRAAGRGRGAARERAHPRVGPPCAARRRAGRPAHPPRREPALLLSDLQVCALSGAFFSRLPPSIGTSCTRTSRSSTSPGAAPGSGRRALCCAS